MPFTLGVAVVVCGALVFPPARTSALVPTYSATRPDYQRPTGGLPLLDKGTEHITVLRASFFKIRLRPISVYSGFRASQIMLAG